MSRLLLALALLPCIARAETCRFTGTTSQNGHLSVQATTTQADGLTTVGVTLEFTIHAWMTDYRYLGQEITTWRGPELQSLAVNQRSLADGDIKRQQWDVFTRNGPHLDAFRVQSKYLTDFRQHHPGFVAHWPPATFGQPWLDDYRRATPERRPDLDLPAAGARTPLAFAFFWSRFLPQAGARIALVLPSFKQNKVSTLELAPRHAGRWLAPLVDRVASPRPGNLARLTRRRLGVARSLASCNSASTSTPAGSPAAPCSTPKAARVSRSGRATSNARNPAAAQWSI